MQLILHGKKQKPRILERLIPDINYLAKHIAMLRETR